LLFAPDGRQLIAFGGRDRQGLDVRHWDVATGREVARLAQRFPTPVPGQKERDFYHKVTAVSPDGSVLAVAWGLEALGDEAPVAEILLWDLAAGRERGRSQGHRGSIWALAFAPDGKTLASGSFDYLAKLWDTTTGVELATLPGHQSTVFALAFAPDGQTLATGSYDQTVKLWSAPPADVNLLPCPAAGAEPARPFGEKEDGEREPSWSRGFAGLARAREKLDRDRDAAAQKVTPDQLAQALGQGYVNLAISYSSQGRKSVAAAHFKESLVYWRQLAEAKPEAEERRVMLSNVLSELGDLRRQLDDLAGSLEAGREALRLRQALSESRPQDLRRHSYLGASYNNVGMTLHRLGQHKEALEHLLKAVEHQRKAFDAESGVAQYRHFLRNHYANLAALHRELKQPAEAAEAAQQAIKLFPGEPVNLFVAARELAQCVPLAKAPDEQTRYTRLAIDALRSALNAGFPQPQARADPAFKSISNEADYRKLFDAPKPRDGTKP
jgi:tetratricopeptide (TPR) repeat protein